ncbi:hypothetical protein D9Q98_007907 [Chlorella vulgaris]|uniref:CNH domain-containing protein n=1 Tax=Chlorella vulgaris TaxID=3077 RepID=A0A9D4THW9_CHLVU|nr:hypothetical protein D9Q98_007907 [Chlorella vulgaris]
MGDGGSDAADGKLIDAFTLVDVLVEKKVVCLEAWSSYLLIGLLDGTLLLCSQRPVPSTESDGEGTGTPLRWTVVQSLRDFGSGQVKQLQVAVERSMLFCLADDGVNAYVLPSLRLKGQAGRTRGATLFAWHSASDVLAVATKRKLVFYRYDGLEFVVQREVSLPDTPTSMRLAGGTTLYAGLARREYVAVDVASGSLTPLFATKGPAASVVFVSPSEVLLAKDNSGMLYGADGRPSRRSSGGAVTWSAAPAVLAISQPYALALTELGAEARLLQPLNAADLRQQLAVTLPDAAATCTVAPTVAEDGSLFVARRGDGTIQQLRPVCFVRQSQQLLQLGEHEEALAMAALIPPQQAQRRRRLEDRIHLAYGRLLFRSGQYEEAMAHFGMSGLAGPLQLLSLFPSLAPPPLLAAAAAEQTVPAAVAAAALRHGDEEVHGSSDVTAAGEEEAMLEEGEEAVAEEGAAAAAEPQGEAFEAAVQVLMPYLLSHRSRLAAAAASAAAPPLRNSTAMAVDAAAAAQADAAAEAAAAAAVVGQQRTEGSATGALLDTSLLLALLAMPDGGALLRFVQRPNCVDLEAGEAALKASGRYSELVALYQTKGRHAAALDLLRALSQSPEQLPAPAQGASAELRGLPGVWAAVKYVCHLPAGQRDLGLISAHAKWMLAADPDAGLEMFSSMDPPLPPSAVLPMLTSYAPRLAAAYLESALASGAASPATYEQELARIYLESIAAATRASGSKRSASRTDTASTGTGSSTGTSSSWQQRGPSKRDAAEAAAAAEDAAAEEATTAGQASAEASLPEFAKLKQLILSSRHLDYEALLLLVPHRLLEIRAALLERLGRHTEALRIYVHRLHQPAAAEAYCDRVYQRRQQQLREQRHTQLAAALRRQRQAAAGGSAVTGGGSSHAAAGSAGVNATGGGGDGSSSLRSLHFGGGSGGSGGSAAGVPATRLQPASRGDSSEDGADIYLLMVQVLLEEEDGSGGFQSVERAPDHAVWGEVACLLSRKRDAIHPLHALSLLPGEVPLTSALPFLEGALWGAGERRRTAALARNLRRSEQVTLLGELADVRSRSTLLTPERNCSICYKRIGAAALVVFPTSMLAHYSCYRRAALNPGPAAENGRTAAATAGGAADGAHRTWS